ncbi:uncharacterized protein LOC131313916 [Rhododendron vialii]|uniref:uncharacterized protein LOC131313916 n=1 Tax=Rhododendron vialii TaxID=182163 RepID=UPI00265DC64A|nr:uncharacterized protein LOC131313916 [Rhododendron vialii]
MSCGIILSLFLPMNQMLGGSGLRALDGTFIPVLPPTEHKARYRSKKGDYATNVLGACSRNLQFVYALSGLEGSATDSRVLENALIRPHGLKIPHGHYYLADAGYTNGPGILAPYRGQRYHINIWRQGHMPQSREEYFNMKHSKARNVAERCFEVLKMRWGILRSYSFYPIRTQCKSSQPVSSSTISLSVQWRWIPLRLSTQHGSRRTYIMYHLMTTLELSKVQTNGPK